MMMNVYAISAVTLFIENMEQSCNFYSSIPGFKLVYGGSLTDSFTTYEVGSAESKNIPKTYLNLELASPISTDYNIDDSRKYFGRIIFHTEDVDKLYSYLKNNQDLSKAILFEDEPRDAAWGERYFHIRDPDGYQLSFAKPLKKRKTRAKSQSSSH
jgi:catechol 2,3-dioxygenase-like lactoylglutathione lyase family enzyme